MSAGAGDPKTKLTPIGAWHTSDDVRRALMSDCRAGRAAWIQLNGVSVDVAATHGALFHALRPCGLCGEWGRAAPETVVLDWTQCTTCGAEGLALYAVLARELVDRGTRVVVCGPEDGDLATALLHTTLGLPPGVEWVAGRGIVAGRIRALGRGAVFGGARGSGSVDDFLDDLEGALGRAGVNAREADLLMATALEVLQNVRSHAGAQHAAAAALVFPRRRPAVIQVGVADGGVGVAGHLLAQERHAWLTAFSDASVAEVVLHHSLSGRATEAGGGGMSSMVRDFLGGCDATLTLRTGTALLSLSSARPDRYRKSLLTYGYGTQTRLEVRARA